MNITRNQRRTIEGTVTSDQCAKTITVQVERTYKHPKYKKYVRKMARYHAHDEKSEAKRGDRVEIQSCRPLSKTKRWTLVRVIDRSKRGEIVDVTSGIVEAPKATGAARIAGTRDGGDA
jgi:small subunit ribosomal protein S17